MIHNRLRAERQNARAATEVTSTALVLVKKDAVDQYFKDQYPNVAFKKAPPKLRDSQALADGREAGAVVELRKGVESSSTTAVGGEAKRLS